MTGCFWTAADVETRVDRLPQLVPVALGHAEQDADHLHGQLGRDVDQEVERRAVLDRGQQPAGPPPQLV